MDDANKTQFWEIRKELKHFLYASIFHALAGIALILAYVLNQQDMIIPIVAAWAVIATAAVAEREKTADELPEPKLELIDDKYRLKASGENGVNAALQVALYREQVRTQKELIVMVIGVLLALIAILCGIFIDNKKPALIAAALAVLYIGLAMRIRNIQIEGLGVKVTASDYENNENGEN